MSQDDRESQSTLIRSNFEEDRAYNTRLDNSIRAMMESSLNYTPNVALQTNVTIPYVVTNQYLYIFTALIAAVFLFGLFRGVVFFKVAVDASMNLINRMFNMMLRSPIAFFVTKYVEMTKKPSLETVANSFKRGLESLNETVREVAIKKSANIATLTRNIEAITSNFRNAADDAKYINETLRKRKTSLVREMSIIEEKLRDTELERKKLQTTLRAYEDELRALKGQLQVAEVAYESSRTTLKRAEIKLEQKKNEQIAVRVAGVAIGVVTSFAIPFVGFVLGSTLLVVSETALQKSIESAKENLQDAENHLQDKKNRIEEKAKVVEKKNNTIKTVNQDIDRLQRNKDEIQEKLRKCQENYEKQTVICNHLQECQHFISITAGRSEILRDQMTFFYDIQTLLGPLKSLAFHLTPELSVDFLECSAFQDFQQNLKAIVSQESSGARMHAVELPLNATVTMTNKEILQHLNCEHFLVPAPMALALFGQVCTLSLKRDFSIEEPTKGFKFLKWPTSFRANLQEISHAISSAFETAHINMDQIHVSAKELPIHLSKALEMLNNFDHDFEKRFRNCMGIIKKNSATCLSLSKDTENTFVEIMETLMELQESCTSAKSSQETQLQEKKIQMKQNEEIKRQIKEQRQFHLDRLSRIKAEILEEEKQYQESLELPGVLETTFVGIAQVTTGIKGMLSKFSKPVTKLKVKYDQRKQNKDKTISEDEKRSYKIAGILMQYIQTLKECYIADEKLNWKILQTCDEMVRVKTNVEHAKGWLLNTDDRRIKEQLLSICKDMIHICQYLYNFKRVMNYDGQKDEHETTVRKMESIKRQLQEIIEEGDRHAAEKRQEKVTPVESRFVEEAKKEDILSATFHKYKMKSQARLHQIQRSQQIVDEEASDLVEINEQLVKALNDLASLKMQNIDYETTIAIFNKSIKSLAGIRQQWGKLVEYFQSVVAIIDCSLNVSLRNIGRYSKGNSRGNKMTNMKLTMINDQVVQAKCLLSGLTHIAGTYTQVSTEFFLPITKQLQCLLGSTKSDSMIEADLHSFKAKCLEVQKEIRNTIQRNEATFLSNKNHVFSFSKISDERDEADDFM